MPAEFESGIFVGNGAWHGLGKLIAADRILKASEVIVEAELDWPVEVAPIVSNDQKRTAIDNYRITRRVTDNAILGIVKRGWKPIQNREAFELFDGVISQGRARYETAGSLQGGSKIFILAKMGEPLLLVNKKDVVERYLLLSNSHDGTCPLKMLFTPVRVVCMNTLNLALNASGADDVTRFAPSISIRHNLPANKSMAKEAERVMGRALKYYELFGEFADFLSRKQATPDVVETIIETVFPANKKGEVTPRIQEHRENVEDKFVNGRGQDIEGVAGTAWALLNGFTEYADNGYISSAKKEKSPSERAYSVWMGGSKGMKERANKVIAKVFV